jgi:hypothetical protein
MTQKEWDRIFAASTEQLPAMLARAQSGSEEWQAILCEMRLRAEYKAHMNDEVRR